MPAPFWPASGSAPWLLSGLAWGLDWRHVARQRPRQGPAYTDGCGLTPCQQSPGGLLCCTAPLSLRHQHLRFAGYPVASHFPIFTALRARRGGVFP